VGSTGCLSAFC